MHSFKILVKKILAIECDFLIFVGVKIFSCNKSRTPQMKHILVVFFVVASQAFTQTPSITAGDNLFIDGIPPIPASIAEAVGRYTEFRSAGFQSWHPVRHEMVISTRFADVSQLHLVKMPGGARTQLTFFPERVAGGSFHPVHGEYFVFSKDVGGGEWFQNYRYDVATGGVTLLTDGKSRNSFGIWSRDGSRRAYTSTRRNGKDTDIYTVDPSDPATNEPLTYVEGGGWGPIDWSPDGKKILVGEYISVNESYLWLVDAGSREKSLLTPKGGKEQIAYGGGWFTEDGKASTLPLTVSRNSDGLHTLTFPR